MAKFYKYEQNNSGGHFDVDDSVCNMLLIEAESARKANHKAKELGCYWNGVRKDRDCPCCGDRWHKAYDESDDGYEFPYKYAVVSEKEKIQYEAVGCTFEVADKPVRDRTLWVIFPTPESYMQYMADQYGWTKPDGRIFYLDGMAMDIFSKKVK